MRISDWSASVGSSDRFRGRAGSRSSAEGDSAVGGVLDTILKGRQDVTEGANAATSADGAFVKADIAESIDLRALIPAFMISELRRAFEIGFLLFVPFLVIDMVVAAILMSRSEEHTSELQSLMRISYAVFCLKKK